MISFSLESIFDVITWDNSLKRYEQGIRREINALDSLYLRKSEAEEKLQGHS